MRARSDDRRNRPHRRAKGGITAEGLFGLIELPNRRDPSEAAQIGDANIADDEIERTLGPNRLLKVDGRMQNLDDPRLALAPRVSQSDQPPLRADGAIRRDNVERSSRAHLSLS